MPSIAPALSRARELVAHLDAFFRRFVPDRRPGGRAEIPLTRQEFRAISAMGARPGWRMGELAAYLGVGQSSLTVLLDRMASRDLVERRRDPTDRRAMRVCLSVHGRRQYGVIRRKRYAIACGMLQGLTLREQERFLVLMRKVGTGAQPPRDRVGGEKEKSR